MKKLNYISRSLSKIQHKRYELYVISRIIHLLDDHELKYIFQQYATRDTKTGKYALIDLYLPQLNIAIEVDEAYHKEQFTEDEVRQKEIEHLDIIVERVDCSLSINAVNQRIDELVDLIKGKKSALGLDFKPWKGLNGYEYYRDKGYFDVNDTTELTSPTEICNCFGLENAAQRGARVLDAETIIWWPNENYELANGWVNKNSNWINKLSLDGNEIEENIKDDDKKEQFLQDALDKDIGKKRIVFYRKRNMLNEKFYRFVGVFELDEEKTRNKKVRIYRKVSDRYDLPYQHSYEELCNALTALESFKIEKVDRSSIEKIKEDIKKANDIYDKGVRYIETMKYELDNHIKNNTYTEYIKKFNNKLKYLKESETKSNNELKEFKDKKLCPDNINKQEFLVNIRRVEAYYNIHSQIMKLSDKYN